MQPSRALIHPRRNRQKSIRIAHPLLGRFPLLVMTLATMLVLFTLAMAQFQAGSDPDLGQRTSSSLVAKAPARTP